MAFGLPAGGWLRSPRCEMFGLKNSAGGGWLGGEAEEGGWLAQGAFFALADQGWITEFDGIEPFRLGP